MNKSFPIPGRLNLLIAVVQLVVLVSVLVCAGFVDSRWGVVLLALVYGVAMNSAYAMLHEAEHNLLHPNPRVNATAGVVLALFFPAPFHLLRQGHIGHHMRNRSDDEAFDFYFEGESPVWKWLQLYGILTGLFWVSIVLSNLLALLVPRFLSSSSAYKMKFDRPTQALVETLNPRYLRLIRFEAALVFLLHGGIMFFAFVPVWRYAVVLFGFGFLWSALQYVHHFGTERDVKEGTRNLRTFAWLDAVWLNHNWHLHHHRDPTIPWIYLPRLDSGSEQRSGLLAAYLRMWRGPQKTNEHVQNRYAGRIIR